MKNANKEEWIEIGAEAKRVRGEIMRLLSKSSGNMTKKTVNDLSLCLKKIDGFRSKAEDEMFRKNRGKDWVNIDIFY